MSMSDTIPSGFRTDSTRLYTPRHSTLLHATPRYGSSRPLTFKSNRPVSDALGRDAWICELDR